MLARGALARSLDPAAPGVGNRSGESAYWHAACYAASLRMKRGSQMTVRPRRSVLYMPGSNARAMEKARELPADAVILDLEDAVAPDAKARARELIVKALKDGGFGRREVVVRVNGLDTAWWADDLAVAAAKPDAVLVPKVSTPEQVRQVAARLASAGAPPGLRIWAMMETPLAMLNVRDIAAAALDPATRLAAFVMGTNDLAKETRARIVPGRAPMLPWLMTCVAAARAFGLDILDGVYNDLGNADGFAAECAQGRDLGFDGKTLIHPAQIAPCNAAFSPPDEEVAWARKIIAAFDLPENAAHGVIQIDGRMVERLHADMARRTVAIADAIAQMQAA
jgi:citrate lyase subunit beta / citryl-CoA lyase